MNRPSHPGRFAEILRDVTAGSALGGFVGLLVGLSASEVVGVVLAALGALLGGVFSVGAEFNKLQSVGRPWRIVGFGGSAIVATLAGLWLRTHDALSPSFARRIEELTSAGVPPEAARSVAIYQHVGVIPSGLTVADVKSTSRTALFAADPQTCSHLGPGRYTDAAGRVNAFVLRGGAWKELAEFARLIAPTEQGALLQAAWRLACEE